MSFAERFDRITEIVEENIEKNTGEILKLVVKEFIADEGNIGYAFEFISGYKLSEYIRKRKLCAAYRKNEERGCGWDNVLELAGYTERSSFDKAFQREYHCSPSQLLKGSTSCNLMERLTIADIIRTKKPQNPRNDEHVYFELLNDEEVSQLQQYMMLQSFFGLSLKQIMLADSLKSRNVDLFEACFLMEQEYGGIETDEYTDYEKDCMYLTINNHCSREIAEKILEDVRKKNPLDFRQFDSAYIYTISYAVGKNGRGELTSVLPHEVFLKLKELLEPGKRDIDFASFCNDLVDCYTISEIEAVLLDVNRTKDRDIWYVMYHFNQTKEDAEIIVNAAASMSDIPIQEMDREYLWFLEWPEGDARIERAKNVPYSKFTELKKKITEQCVCDDYDIEQIIVLTAERGMDFETAIKTVKTRTSWTEG